MENTPATPDMWIKGEALYHLTDYKFASVTSVRGEVLVHIRQSTNNLKRTKQGISIRPAEFEKLMSVSSAISRDIAALTSGLLDEASPPLKQKRVPTHPLSKLSIPPVTTTTPSSAIIPKTPTAPRKRQRKSPTTPTTTRKRKQPAVLDCDNTTQPTSQKLYQLQRQNAMVEGETNTVPNCLTHETQNGNVVHIDDVIAELLK